MVIAAKFEKFAGVHAGVPVEVAVAVFVGVLVAVFVAVFVGVPVLVGVEVAVGVPATQLSVVMCSVHPLLMLPTSVAASSRT